MKRLTWIAMFLATSASGQTDTLPPQTAGELDEIIVSAPEPRYVAPTTRDRIGRIWAPVYLDGKGPFRLVLDTGATHSAVIERVAQELGAHSNVTARLHGATGTAIVPIIRVDELAVGDLMLAPAKLPVVLDVFGGADGVLGNDGLRDKRIVIDFRHDSITIKRSRRERPGDGFRTLPIAFARDYLPIIDARVGNVPVKAIIDTGAPDSLGNMALVNALKQRVGNTPDAEIVGVTLDIEHGYRARMPTIYLQGLEVRGATLNFGDVYIFQHWRMTSEPTIMLGMDVLGVMDQIIIDYKTRQLQIRTANARTGTPLKVDGLE
jgi:predicted aspartyl protease